MWRDEGKPRYGEKFRCMSNSRAKFKYTLRHIRQTENRIRSNTLANKLLTNSQRDFWKEIKVTHNSKIPLPTSIESTTGKNNIANLWIHHFQSIFNCIPDSGDNLRYETIYSNGITVSPQEVQDAINQLDCNKACGLDQIYAEHLKFSDSRLYYLLSMCFIGLFVHGVLPDSLMSVVIVPIIKDKSGRINEKDNYRPISLANILSKVMERILLDRMSIYLCTSSNQFGFKPKLGSDMCIYAIKEIVDRHRVFRWKYISQSFYVCR